MKRQYKDINPAGLKKLYDELEAANCSEGALAEFSARYPRELAKLRQQAKLRPVPVDGNRFLGRRMAYFETTLRDGTVGYFQRRTDDCLQASIATLLQVPMDQVPDLRFDKQRAAGKEPEEIKRHAAHQLGQWEREHGLTVTVHPKPPTTARRWVGIAPGHGQFNDHCLVMSRDEAIWDTTQLLPPSKHESLIATPCYTVQDIEYGFTID